MTKIDKHIQIVRSTSRELSLMSSKSSFLVREVLEKEYTKVGETIINTSEDVAKLLRKNPDLVFLGIKNSPLPSKLGKLHNVLSDYLEAHSIHYVGSDKIARDFGRRKDFAKQAVQRANLPTAGYFMAKPGQYKSTNTLPLKFPLFIKPPHRGHGVGIDDASVVRTFAEYENKVESIFHNYQSESLVEQYLTGREFTVALLEQPNSSELLSMPVEIITDANARGDRILSSNIKTQDSEQIVAIEDAATHTLLCILAKNIFLALGARDFGRIDIRMSDAGTAYFLEANLPPGLGRGYFARACEINRGMSYESMILKIAELGILRSSQKPLLAVS